MRKTTLGFALLLGLIVCPTARADTNVKPHGLFTSNMVLQQEMKVPVWGTAAKGELVRVEINGQKASATTGDDGKWMVTLEPMKAGGPFTLTIQGTDEPIVLKNVLVGEVWLCTGQSNMEWSLNSTRDGKEAIASSANPMIRLFDVPKIDKKQEPQTALASGAVTKGSRHFGKWMESSPTTAPAFSAVGFYFGRALQRDLNVPVGLINSSWGGTAAERWTSKAVMESNPDLKGLKGSDLYNGMIVPLEPFAFRGVIWYQGESNAGRAKQYYHLFSAMIKNWRDDWKQGDFPFLFVQLAPWDVPKDANQWPELRESQLLTSLKVKNTAMAVITDAGDPKDIHPQDKTPVGERLARAAEALAYGKKIEYIGPLFSGVKFDGGKAVVSFKHVGGGLEAKGGALKGFTIAGKDGKFVPAEATINGKTVVVRSVDVPEPTAVRYGWANFPIVNLYSVDGLPATPFRSDVPDYYKEAMKKQ